MTHLFQPHVTLVGAGPGAADLITVRGANLLAKADIVFHDALVDPVKFNKLERMVPTVGLIKNRLKADEKKLEEAKLNTKLPEKPRFEDADDLMIINKSGLTIRMAIEDLRVMGRATQGVKLINLKGNDSIAAVTKVMKDDVVEVVVDEALRFLPRGMDIPCFTEWVKETFEQNKKLPYPPTRKDYEH